MSKPENTWLASQSGLAAISKRCWAGSENVFIWWKRLVDRPQEGIHGRSAVYPKARLDLLENLAPVIFWCMDYNCFTKLNTNGNFTVIIRIEEDGKFHVEGDLMVTLFSLLYPMLKGL
jgi:hypothetical protein